MYSIGSANGGSAGFRRRDCHARSNSRRCFEELAAEEEWELNRRDAEAQRRTNRFSLRLCVSAVSVQKKMPERLLVPASGWGRAAGTILRGSGNSLCQTDRLAALTEARAAGLLILRRVRTELRAESAARAGDE